MGPDHPHLELVWTSRKMKSQTTGREKMDKAGRCGMGEAIYACHVRDGLHRSAATTTRSSICSFIPHLAVSWRLPIVNELQCVCLSPTCVCACANCSCPSLSGRSWSTSARAASPVRTFDLHLTTVTDVVIHVIPLRDHEMRSDRELGCVSAFRVTLSQWHSRPTTDRSPTLPSSPTRPASHRRVSACSTVEFGEIVVLSDIAAGSYGKWRCVKSLRHGQCREI